ncbi:aldehyde ferredoxin oxidoreductase family protein [Halodesulfurarchaeum sp. HSR-GB]|uniref:aldehyde ferredoxin oxidoreductase family protein n=1 Tax=Halodesulfurarchaeum sp. HSR-GB TaxID=3074077 RepID=UPI002861A6F3|nr:aldehyde ferredoxin oxidoreductase family protein [Halodesulfurarchaeum sp. HSR-GB]MDR5656257.1 aldehyde ferredoxin oxidoreductase family protein [Halodesulfurarchaeum sp. HSR-GB]
MTELGGFNDCVARVDLTDGAVDYESIPEEDAKKYIGARGLGAKYVFDNGPEVDPESEENILTFMTGPLTGSRAVMSGRIAVVTKSPLTGTVTDSHHGGWSGARLKWAGLDGLVFEGAADEPVYAVVEDGEVELRDASHVWGMTTHEARETLEEEVEGEYGKNLSYMGIGPAGEEGVKYACIINEDDRASGRGGTGCVMGSKNLKAVMVKSKTDMLDPANPEAFADGTGQAMSAVQGSDVTAPNEGGLSVYGTNVLMNLTEEIDALPTRNGKYTSTRAEREDDPEDPNIEAENVSGEYVRENILVDEPTCHSCPVACKKEVEVETTVDGEDINVRMESLEYEPAFTFGPNSMNDDVEKLAVMIDRCNKMGIDAIETGNMMAMAMEMDEKGYVEDTIDWGDADQMIGLIERIGRREDDFADALAEGAAGAAERLDAHDTRLDVKNQTIPAYDPRGMKGMAIGYATSNRGACHLRGYTPAAEVLGIPEEVDPIEAEGKGELLTVFQDLHAVSDSFDICKFSAFAEGIEEYTKQYNGMTGRDLTEEELNEAGERIYTLERYYNNLNGFDGEDDSLPSRFLEGAEDAVPGSGAAEGELVDLDFLKDEYYDVRGWEDGVVPEAKLDELGIEVGPGTGVGGAASADD